MQRPQPVADINAKLAQCADLCSIERLHSQHIAVLWWGDESPFLHLARLRLRIRAWDFASSSTIDSSEDPTPKPADIESVIEMLPDRLWITSGVLLDLTPSYILLDTTQYKDPQAFPTLLPVPRAAVLNLLVFPKTAKIGDGALRTMVAEVLG